MKKMKISISFLCLTAIAGLFWPLNNISAATVLNPAPGYLHLKWEESPYLIKETVNLSGYYLVKIDNGVEVIFSPGANLCFFGECLRGDWIYKEGLGGVSIVFPSPGYLYLSAGETKVPYRAKTGPTTDYISKEKDIRVSLRSLEGSAIGLQTRKDDGAIYDFVVELAKVGVEEKSLIEERFFPLVTSSSTAAAKIISSDGGASSSVVDAAALDDEGSALAIDKDFSRSQAGNIFLEVEKNGEAWYVNPDDLKRYYLGRPADAFAVMKGFSLGVKHEFLTSREVFPARLKGKILLDVEDRGRAYYINPSNQKAYYLGRPFDAFNLMRGLGIGISESNLRKIEKGGI